MTQKTMTQKILKTLIFISTIAFLALFALFVIDSFGTDSDASAFIQYEYPSSGTYTTYEVEHVMKGYEGSVSEVSTYAISDAEKQALFEEYRQREDWEAEYNEARDIADSDTNGQSFTELEEDRIEAYCDENGVLSCSNIQYTCDDKYSCHLVTITCDDYDYDPYKEIKWGKKYGCDEWEVTVAVDDFDIRDVDDGYWEKYGYNYE